MARGTAEPAFLRIHSGDPGFICRITLIIIFTQIDPLLPSGQERTAGPVNEVPLTYRGVQA